MNIYMLLCDDYETGNKFIYSNDAGPLIYTSQIEAEMAAEKLREVENFWATILLLAAVKF